MQIKNGIVYLDYFSAMADERKGLPKSLSEDGVHPNLAGYRIMELLAGKAIAEALKVELTIRFGLLPENIAITQILSYLLPIQTKYLQALQVYHLFL